MGGSLGFWKTNFQANSMRPATVEKVNEWWELETRESNKRARNAVNSAFNAHLKQSYGRSQTAKFFLKYPTTALHILLEAWRRYMDSPDYIEQRERSNRRNDSADTVYKRQQLKYRCNLSKNGHHSGGGMSSNTRGT